MRALATLLLAPYIGQLLDAEVARAILADMPTEGEPIDLSAMEVRQCGSFTFRCERVASIIAELHPLHEAQWAETEKYRAGLEMKPDYANGLLREQRGEVLQCTARRDGRLVGHLRWYVHRSMHTSQPHATEDTLYLIPECRGIGRTALHFMEYAEDCAFDLGVREFSVDAKTGAVERFLSVRGYRPVSTRMHKIMKERNREHPA